MAFVILLLCISSSGISALNSSSSSGTYKTPMCAPDGYYCHRSRPPSYTCLARTQRCTAEHMHDNPDKCTQKTYQHCSYAGSGWFHVFRHATRLQSSIQTSSRRGWSIPGIRNPLNCLDLKTEHHFITYRGLMYEFGDYGSRVQDPNDPEYEYKPDRREELGSPVYLGLSNCTYQEVMEFTRIWTAYELCSHNCQDFAKGLGTYLTTNCAYVRQRKQQSDDNLAEYIFSIARTNCNGSQSVAPLPLVTFSTTIIIGVLALMQL